MTIPTNPYDNYSATPEALRNIGKRQSNTFEKTEYSIISKSQIFQAVTTGLISIQKFNVENAINLTEEVHKQLREYSNPQNNSHSKENTSQKELSDNIAVANSEKANLLDIPLVSIDSELKFAHPLNSKKWIDVYEANQLYIDNLKFVGYVWNSLDCTVKSWHGLRDGKIVHADAVRFERVEG